MKTFNAFVIKFFLKLILEREKVKERERKEREKHQFFVPLIHVFTG